MQTVTESFKKTMSLILNCAIIVLETIPFLPAFMSCNFSGLIFYTQDSNLFAFITSTICVVSSIICFIKKENHWPLWVKLLKFMSTCCLFVTFLVVICVLAPMAGKGGYAALLLKGNMLYHHFICPVLAIISFVFFENGIALPKKSILIALIPTLLYAIILIILNISHTLVGPYPFLHVYEQPVYMSILWGILILGAALGIAFIVWKLNSLAKK